MFCVSRHLRHKNLVQLVGVIFSGSGLKSIVMELMGKVRLYGDVILIMT